MMSYEDLLAAAQANPAGADFHALRMAYARSERYNPYNHHVEGVQALNEALRGADPAAALEAVNHLLANHYLDIEAHMAADYVHTLLDHPDQSAYHRAFATGLIRAILATGDGRDYATAFIVLDVPEEYTVLRVLGFAPAGQQLIEHGGHWFDVMDGRAPETERTARMFFNIDLPHGWLDTHVGGEGET